jgi:hypothetical protein
MGAVIKWKPGRGRFQGYPPFLGRQRLFRQFEPQQESVILDLKKQEKGAAIC